MIKELKITIKTILKTAGKDSRGEKGKTNEYKNNSED
jgi:hypothetical protein